ncbi:phage tail family protein [Paenibacillus sp. ACRRX]|uniref:distal tail protein Dit n=1 Tax=Paenibacillus sp. ACRRX TaxID=2918206 RepID=UPI001EF48F07|nr:distal tail protein Dit [Paenibacillus sp. ACRRX]MCG7407688.1 phage tail family protein [Paenibacillus sp. ACRRX]
MTIEYDVRVNGTWLSTIGAALYERRLPILPESDESTLKLAGRDGELSFGSSYNPRRIEMTLLITSTPSEYHRTLALLARIFNGNRREVTVEFSDLPNRIYRAVYNGTLAPDGQVGSRMVNVSLKANDPWPESTEKVTEVTISHSPEITFITSNGDVQAEPAIVLTNIGTNTIRNFRITNEYTI